VTTPPDRRSPGALALQVLTIVRAHGAWMTVRDVYDVLSQERPIAYTTVLTVMQRLVQQGHLEHVREGRSGSYRVTRNADPSGARSMVDQALARFGTIAITQFVERSREDPELLAELRRQLDAPDAG
jgi:predicted transcriptional regulator